MAQRTIETTSLHDRVVREIKNNLNQRDFDIYINPGSEKNAGISGNYPDVIMTTKGEKTVKFILEVETSDSITKEEAEGQWKKYATEIEATFYLVVPAETLQKTQFLCQQVGINTRFVTYIIQENNIIFNFN